ncbi:hypothetical protein HK102_013722, partial [Quaeritorhiza haematococci]
CHVAFHTANQQREHYRSDWHRYNLKRKVVDLPPVTAENFAQRVQTQQAANQAAVERSESVFECAACSKSYSSQNAYSNHLQSKKHKENEVKYQKQAERRQNAPASSAPAASSTSTPKAQSLAQKLAATATPSSPSSSSSVVPDVGSSSTAAMEDLIDSHVAAAVHLDVEHDCLFCNTNRAANFEANMEHMVKAHSFFVPDIEFIADLKGLVQYLADKVSVACVCLYCNGKGRTLHSLEAVRKHMVDKGHCKVPYEDGGHEEIIEFYDFGVDEEEDDDAEWEDVDDDDEMVEVDDDAEDVDDEDYEDDDAHLASQSRLSTLVSELESDSVELVLPTGYRVGHRAHRRIWKQNVRPTSDSPYSTLITRIAGQYKMLGYPTTAAHSSMALIARSGGASSGAVVVGNGGRVMTRGEIHDRRMQGKLQTKVEHDHKSRVGMKANRLQKHFRSQIGFD